MNPIPTPRTRLLLVALASSLVLAACGDDGAPSDSAADTRSPLRNPSLANETAPETFQAVFETTKGDIVIEAERHWSPAGVDRLYNLIRIGYFRDTPFYRVMPGFVAQFGFNWDPKVNLAWKDAYIPAEPNKVSNMQGHIAFAQMGNPNTRTCQFFINLKNNSRLDGQGFPTVARVVEGWDVVQALNAEYRDQPDQPSIAKAGISYLKSNFPRLDYITKASIIE